jgi:hypothetical protein
MVCVGQTGRTIEARCKEHMRHTSGQPEKSVADLKRHNIDFSRISILDKATGYRDRKIKEAVEIRLYPRNFNRDGGFTLSRSWFPVTNLLKQYRDPPIQRQGQAYDTTH